MVKSGFKKKIKSIYCK